MGTGRDVDEFVTEMTDKINKAYMAMKETNNHMITTSVHEVKLLAKGKPTYPWPITQTFFILWHQIF
jgi:hypothetical protein